MADQQALRTHDFLDLSGEILSTEDLACLAENKTITELHIGYGELDDQGLEMISRLCTLRCLNIDHTAVTDIGLAHLAHLARLTELRTLHAQNIAITDTGVRQLQVLRLLYSLQLSGTNTGDENLDWISKLNLEKLAVGQNTTDDGVAKIASLKGLRELDLSRSAITGTSFGALAHLPQLSLLSLNELKLCDDGFRLLQNVESLVLLFLFETPISSAQLRLLGRLSQLEFLHLKGNGLSPKDIIWLEAHLPDCAVVPL